MNETPWLSTKSLRIIHLLLSSYQKTFDENLLSHPWESHTQKQNAKNLFKLERPVIAHDIAKDPCLNYANAAALQLWGRYWDQMIGIPSRLTAPTEEIAQRQNALNEVYIKNSIKNYEGIRINSQGELFMIKNARIWTLLDEENKTWGQAATFNCWWKI